MIRVSVLYPTAEGKRFDLAYYKDRHMALVKDRIGGMGLLRVEVDKGVAGGAPGAPPPFTAIGHLYFNSIDEFQKAMKAHGREFMADIPNFTDIQAQFQISEILG